MGVGFLHGVLPDGLSRTYIQTPTQIQVITTDEILFPAEVRKKIESELHVRFSVVVTRDWDSILAHVVSSPGVDLLFLPSFWARTLGSQYLLADISSLKSRVASDFMGDSAKAEFQFLPFYWMKTSILGPQNESFDAFLQNKKENVLFLLADEDLILKHFQVWKEQGILDSVLQKKILSLQLDQIQTEDARLGAVEGPLLQEPATTPSHRALLNALLIWGAAIPESSTKKTLAMEVLDLLTSVEYQERDLLKTPFNSALASVTANQIPLQRRAEAVRNLQLKDTIILERKNKDAKTQLRNEFNFIL